MSKRVWLVLILGSLIVLVGCGSAQLGEVRQGELAPDFSLKDLQGNEVHLSDFQGRPILINFWASWCPPCRVEMPGLQELHEAGGGEGLAILAVNTLYQDNQADVESFVQEMGLTFPILLDQDGEVSVIYRIGSLPTSVFVDPEGRVHLIQIGPVTKSFVNSVLREME